MLLSILPAARRAVGALTLALLAPCAAAQTADTLRRHLGEAEVNARRADALSAAAAPSLRLDSAALARSGATEVGAALRRLPGVNLRDYGGAGGLKTVSVRGLGAAHTAVTYDGLPVADARAGQVDLGQFSLGQMGALSLTVAGGGQLLCPVRSLAAATVAIEAAQPAPGGRAALSFGAFGQAQPSLRLAARAGGRTLLTAGATFRYGRNDYPFTLRNGLLTTRERRKNSRMQAWTAEAAALHTTRRGGSWRSRLYYYESHRRLPGQVVLYTDEGDERLRERSAFAQTMWRQRVGAGWTLMGGGKWGWQESSYADIDGQYPGGALRQHYAQREWYATAGAAWQRGPWGAALALDAVHQALHSADATTGRARRLGLLQSLTLRYADRRLVATLRLAGHVYRNHRAGGTAARDACRLTPLATVAWTAWQGPTRGGRLSLRLRAQGEEHFRLPTFTESYYHHLGSQSLRPEVARRGGAGLQLSLEGGGGRLSPELHLSLDGYGGVVRQRIASIPYNLYVWRTLNFGRVRMGGLDASLALGLSPATRHRLTLQAGYSLQRAADLSDATTRSYGLQPAYMPRHSGSASLTYEGPWLGATLSLAGASERWSTHEHTAGTRLPGYAEMGVGVFRAFALGRCRLDVRADVTNLLDEQYEVIRRYPMPGRAWRLALALTW